jgi:hypothetical protein
VRHATGERLKIVLSGMLAGDPHQGGATSAVLQYLTGLQALGHDVLVVEPVAHGALKPRGTVSEYFRSLALPADRAALLCRGGKETVGVPYPQLAAFAAEADLLLNISGMLRDEQLVEPIPVRTFVDLDPGFNQVWHTQGENMGFELHNRFATVGGLIGRPGCPIPTCGRRWIATLPPVALRNWPRASDPPRHDAFTTVGHWRSYGSIEHGGIHYGQRAHSLRGLIELPRLGESRFQLALGIHPDEQTDLQALAANGWELLDPLRVAGSPVDYADFVRGSKAELCVPKSGYVLSHSGWFSDRSACYLASGRPVVAQDTGFAERLPTGEGLLAFASTAEAAQAVADIESAAERHRASARMFAEEYLEAEKVLSALLDRLSPAPLALS